MADMRETRCINEAGIARRSVVVAVLKHNHQTAEPANTPPTIGDTVDHSGPSCEPDSGPSAAKIPMNDRMVIGLDSVRANVVRKSRATVVRGAAWES